MTDQAIALSADLDRANVASLAQEAAEVLASGAALRLDGRKVTRVRLIALQMLASAARTAAANGGSFTLEEPSDELMAALELSGLKTLVLTPEGSDA